MRNLFASFSRLALLLVLAAAGLLFNYALLSCATERGFLSPPPNPASMQARVDSAMRANGMVAKKITIQGPVTFTSQYGTGNTATSAATDNNKAGQKGGAAATAKGATATATTKKGGLPWWVFLAGSIGVILLWEWVKKFFPSVTWLRFLR